MLQTPKGDHFVCPHFPVEQMAESSGIQFIYWENNVYQNQSEPIQIKFKTPSLKAN